MFDWKKKVDDWKEQQKHDYEARLITAEAAAARKAQAEIDDSYQHLAQFHCHICKVSARKPAQAYIGGHRSGKVGIPDYPGVLVNDWSRPGDLYQCEKCQKWVCENHIRKGICQTCAEKL